MTRPAGVAALSLRAALLAFALLAFALLAFALLAFALLAFEAMAFKVMALAEGAPQEANEEANEDAILPVERERVIAGPSGPLGGVLTEAAAQGPGGGPADAAPPVVVIIPGSGPTNRDGDNPLGVVGGPLKQLAHALAARGVVAVRIDKRGFFSSAAALADPNAATLEDYADDALAWAAALTADSEPETETEAACVWLLGHSEGALVALIAGARGSNHLCGLVLVGAPGRPAAEIILEQIEANPFNAPLLEDARAVIAALDAGRRIDVATRHPAVAGLFRPEVQDFIINLFDADPIGLMAATRLPTLVVAGGRDLQIPASDGRALAAARADVAFVALPHMNHVLRDAPADRLGNLAVYLSAEAPLSPGLADAIAAFVARGGGEEPTAR